MKKIALLIIMMMPIIMMSQTQVPSGPVSGTWDLSGSPYMVNGEIYIAETETLVIEPGVEVRFTGWYKFIVNGSLMAEGTETSNILFTADDSNDHWYGLRFIESNKTSVLDFCIVEYGETLLNGGIGIFPENAGGGILVSTCPAASISIKNSIIRNNEAFDGGGILCSGSSITLENCEISSNSATSGGGLNIIFNSSLTMTNSTIANNYAENEGGGLICVVLGTLELIENTFIHNICQDAGGGLCIYDPLSFNIAQNIIAHNSAEDGGGIFLDDAYNHGSFSDNTIAYNGATTNGGGIYCAGSTTHSFESDIMYFNTANGINNQIYLSNNAIPIISYCNIQDSTDGISGPGASAISLANCVYGDPLFSDPMADDFSLTWENYPEPDNTMSSCIDAGCPGFPEPDGSCNDIGAEFFFQQLDVPEATAPISVSQTSFIAKWDLAIGALSYILEVAEDNIFTSLHDSVEVFDLEYLVEDLDQGEIYFYRLRAKNTALESGYSNTMDNTLIVGLDELDEDEIRIYTYYNKLQISTPSDISNTGKVMVYNTVGQLILLENIQPGSSTIDPGLSNQIIIVKVIIEGRIFQQKLMIH